MSARQSQHTHSIINEGAVLQIKKIAGGRLPNVAIAWAAKLFAGQNLPQLELPSGCNACQLAAALRILHPQKHSNACTCLRCTFNVQSQPMPTTANTDLHNPLAWHTSNWHRLAEARSLLLNCAQLTSSACAPLRDLDRALTGWWGRWQGWGGRRARRWRRQRKAGPWQNADRDVGCWAHIDVGHV